MREIRPWCISRQLWWGHRIPVWYCDPCEETIVAEVRQRPERCGACGGELRQEEDVLDTWFSSAIWPFATLGWPDDTPELRAFYPTSFLTTAREILFLWVARMIMTGLEFAGDVPFKDVYVHSVIQARDGRRMSKSLGTGIDPLEEIDVHGADALRFGLLAMSSTQDVRYSDAKVQQGRDLSNKLWNASRLILLNAAEVEAKPRRRAARGPLDPLAAGAHDRLGQREARQPTTSPTRSRRPTPSSGRSSATGTWRSPSRGSTRARPRSRPTCSGCCERTLALLHPIMPFVSEEVWSYHPSRKGHLAVHPFPQADESLFDEEAEAEMGEAIELTRSLRTWRELVDLAAKATLPVRTADPPPEFVAAWRGSSQRTTGRSDRLGRRRCRCSPRRRSTPRRSPLGSSSGARSCAPRSPAPRASSPTRSSSPARRPSWSRRSGPSWSATGPSSRSSARIDPQAYLDSLEPVGWKLGLERMHKLSTALGLPQHRFASIHVVGTNGKSSVTRMIAALLEAHGMRTGACVSPHADALVRTGADRWRGDRRS